jgi:hypothetical protein
MKIFTAYRQFLQSSLVKSYVLEGKQLMDASSFQAMGYTDFNSRHTCAMHDTSGTSGTTGNCDASATRDTGGMREIFTIGDTSAKRGSTTVLDTSSDTAIKKELGDVQKEEMINAKFFPSQLSSMHHPTYHNHQLQNAGVIRPIPSRGTVD